MALKDRQRLITALVSHILQTKAVTDIKFPWFINQHNELIFNHFFTLIDSIFNELKGTISNKKLIYLQCDAYYGNSFNFMFEFDEFQHFSTPRMRALSQYPTDLKLNFSTDEWKHYCNLYLHKADKYRFNKTTKDFNFQGGRICQRAYLDCFRDFLPQQNGLNPTLRICEFEVKDVDGFNAKSTWIIDKLLNQKLKCL